MHGIARFKHTAAEVKYNVTTDFPHLGLHSAAASGNLGLVDYALSHGQPINSVLHGVLPLHAACSGGDEQVVNLLIEHGADVNAPRLPLRYTNDRNRDASAPIVGTSGSTPLHFACANGHTNIVRILLQHGAHPDRADKHGITPEVLALESGHDVCAKMIREWLNQKDQDLRDRAEYPLYPESVPEERRGSFGSEGNRGRLGVKRSIDRLNLFKTPSTSALVSLHLIPPVSTSSSNNTPPSPRYGQDGYVFPVDSMPDLEECLPPRRPSLPHIYDNIPQHNPRPSHSPQRPSSAGSDVQAQRLGAGKTGSKYSLRHIFRKHSTEVPADSPPPLSSSPPNSNRLLTSSYRSTEKLSHKSSRSRLVSDSGVDARPHPVLSATELHHKLSVDDITSPLEPEVTDQVSLRQTNSPAMRPGILLRHNRSSSSGQRPSSRALRFDSSSTNSSNPRTSSPRRVEKLLDPKGNNSVNSLKTNDAPGSVTVSLTDQDDSALPTISTFLYSDDMDEDEVLDHGSRYHGRMTRLDEMKRENGECGDDSESSVSPDESRVSAIVKEFPFNMNNPQHMEDLESRLSIHEVENTESRLRGNSVSSTYTNASVDNPQLSSSGTTSGSASVNVITPAMNSSPLPTSHIPSLPAMSQDMSYESIGVSGDAKSRADSFSVELASFSGKRSNVPTDIDISAISSHAQAEALVRRAEKSILEMDDDLCTSTSGSARSPLSAKLAAYGESLALERRLKQEEQNRAGGRQERTSVDTGLHREPSFSASSLGEYEMDNMQARAGLDRKFSLEEHGAKIRSNASKVRRPHTAGSTGFDHGMSGGGFPRRTVDHQWSESSVKGHADADSPNRKRELPSAVEIVQSPGPSPSDAMNPKCLLYSGSLSETRSQTPDTASGMFDTAKVVKSRARDVLPRKSPREHSRQISRTNKLAKMGFSATEFAQSPNASVLRNTGSTSKFGSLRSLVHSLKGKGSLRS